MIRVVAKMLLKEDKIDAFIEGAKEFVPASRNDNGNIGYTLNVSIENPCQFAIIENWEDKESLDAHMTQPHFLKSMELTKECAAGEPVIELFRDVV